MIEKKAFDVIVVGGGPAGLAAATAAAAGGARVGLIEREDRLGGILKQCIHDGFGLVRYGERLAGPEYALRSADAFAASGSESALEAFVTRAEARDEGGRKRYALSCVSKGRGAFEWSCASLVLATGCRERTDRQVLIHGDRPAGIMTAGLAQYMVNVQGWLPGRKCVILGSGDIGLIMARRLLLEGMEVEGVYEIKGEPSGLSRNVQQCLDDFGIPLSLGKTVVSVRGRSRVEAVVVADADHRLQPLPGTEREIPCDTLVLSVGLIPENELALALDLPMDPATRGPRVDQGMHSAVDGVFCCGNALHVNDLVDYVSESGETAGRSAADYALGRRGPRSLSPVKAGPGFLACVPQFVDRSSPEETVLYFRSNATLQDGGTVRVRSGAGEIASKRYAVLRPPEMERLLLGPGSAGEGPVSVELERKEAGSGSAR